MRFFLTVIAILVIFTVNQTAQAFERCEDASCMTVSMDAQKQAEHQKKDPACAAHCALSGHHIVAMPQDMAVMPQAAGTASLHWRLIIIPESTIPEGVIEPPSIA